MQRRRPAMLVEDMGHDMVILISTMLAIALACCSKMEDMDMWMAERYLSPAIKEKVRRYYVEVWAQHTGKRLAAQASHCHPQLPVGDVACQDSNLQTAIQGSHAHAPSANTRATVTPRPAILPLPLSGCLPCHLV
jgi:hypothetical protein